MKRYMRWILLRAAFMGGIPYLFMRWRPRTSLLLLLLCLLLAIVKTEFNIRSAKSAPCGESVAYCSRAEGWVLLSLILAAHLSLPLFLKLTGLNYKILGGWVLVAGFITPLAVAAITILQFSKYLAFWDPSLK